MASRQPAEQVTALLDRPLRDAGYDLEHVAIRRAGRRHTVAVAVDRDGGVDLDALAEVTRTVSALLDDHDAELPPALQAAYDLEVSSRGTATPLTLPRHWRRSAGRLVEVRRVDGTTVTGRVTAADDEGADLDVGGTLTRVPYADIRRALVQLEFRRPPATGAAEEADRDPDDVDTDDVDTDDDGEEETP